MTQKTTLTMITQRSIEEGIAMEKGKNTKEYGDASSVIEMNELDMLRMGIEENTPVRVRSECGEVIVTAVCGIQVIPEGVCHIRQGVWANQVVPGRTQSTGVPQYSGFSVTVVPAPDGKIMSARDLILNAVGMGWIKDAKNLEGIGCPYCGCSCDDIRVKVADDGKKILEIDNACAIGTEIFLQATSSERITRPRLIQPDGSWKKISYHDAMDYAAKAIIAAKKPLMYGFGSTTCEAQREAARLMELGGGVLDNCASICHGPSLIAHFDNGYPSCTLGEVKNRADVIVYWGANPIHAHPRHMSRYAVYPLGFFKGNGFFERTVIVVDPRKTDTAGIADYYLQNEPGHDYELFNAFRMVLHGYAKDIPESVAGIPKQSILEVTAIFKKAKFGVIFFGMGLTHTDGRNHNIDIAISLIRELNEFSKWSIMAMRGHFNVAGANRVWCWSYGFPYCLDLSKGDHAHMNPGETSTIDLANRDEIDLFINIGTDAAAHFPINVVKHLKKHTWITIDPNMSMAAEVADLHIPVGISGVEVPGIVYRMDNVPIQYRKVIDMPEGMLSDEEVLSGIADRVEEILANQGTELITTKNWTKKIIPVET